MMNGFLESLNKKKLIFIFGTGGAGKTTHAASLALQLVALGKKVFLLSANEEGSLSEILQRSLSSRPKELQEGFWATEIDTRSSILAFLRNIEITGHSVASSGLHPLPLLEDYLLQAKNLSVDHIILDLNDMAMIQFFSRFAAVDKGLFNSIQIQAIGVMTATQLSLVSMRHMLQILKNYNVACDQLIINKLMPFKQDEWAEYARRQQSVLSLLEDDFEGFIYYYVGFLSSDLRGSEALLALGEKGVLREATWTPPSAGIFARHQMGCPCCMPLLDDGED
ncbi:ArsA family ATPase [Pelistega sp. NLN82]|uniref:arsenite-transporting ATPase n=1 Tax=Pelistega ratti TaxID=2652177 RepID=A0A6L9Y8A9_9BURK|nr:ArsA-related P-loop ATPase [Pelistega ratti]NEN76616.1 ArsA family ATPase [Pelistega ratti]